MKDYSKYSYNGLRTLYNLSTTSNEDKIKIREAMIKFEKVVDNALSIRDEAKIVKPIKSKEESMKKAKEERLKNKSIRKKPAFVGLKVQFKKESHKKDAPYDGVGMILRHYLDTRVPMCILKVRDHETEKIYDRVIDSIIPIVEDQSYDYFNLEEALKSIDTYKGIQNVLRTIRKYNEALENRDNITRLIGQLKNDLIFLEDTDAGQIVYSLFSEKDAITGKFKKRFEDLI